MVKLLYGRVRCGVRRCVRFTTSRDPLKTTAPNEREGEKSSLARWLDGSVADDGGGGADADAGVGAHAPV